MEEKKIMLDLSPELNRLIKERRFPLEQKLKELPGVDSLEMDYIAVENEPTTRDLSLIIITSAASFYIVLKAIGQLIESIKGGPITTVAEVMEPVYKPDGSLVLNADQNPIMRPVKSVISGGKKTSDNTIEISKLFRLKDNSKVNS